MVGRLEGSPSHHESVDSGSEGPQVDHFVVASALEHLGCPVEQSASDGEHVCLPSPIQHLPADAKIDDLDYLLDGVIEDVLRFDIPVADALGVYVGQGLQNLIDDFLQNLQIVRKVLASWRYPRGGDRERERSP